MYLCTIGAARTELGRYGGLGGKVVRRGYSPHYLLGLGLVVQQQGRSLLLERGVEPGPLT